MSECKPLCRTCSYLSSISASISWISSRFSFFGNRSFFCNPPFSAVAQGRIDIARHVIHRTLIPRVLSYVATYAVASGEQRLLSRPQCRRSLTATQGARREAGFCDWWSVDATSVFELEVTFGTVFLTLVRARRRLSRPLCGFAVLRPSASTHQSRG